MPNYFYEFDDLRMDCASHILWRGNVRVILSPMEFQILLALAERPMKTVRKDDLFNRVWMQAETKPEESLKTHILRLRAKLGPAGKGYIKNVRGKGYMLNAEVRVLTEEESMRSWVSAPDLPEPVEDKIDAVPIIPPAAADPEVVASPVIRIARPFPRSFGFAAASLAFLVIAAALALSRGHGGRTVAPVPSPGRILVRSSSESRAAARIAVGERPQLLAISTGGEMVFATENYGRTLSIIRTKDNSVHTIALPGPGGPLAAAPGGKLYIGSLAGGLMVIDVATGRVRRDLIPTGGPVHDLAVTSDGEKIFLATSKGGLKRLSTKSGELVRLSHEACAEHLALDSEGRRLYVGYECNGPKGRPGHDSVEIFDVDTETSLGIVGGPPMVGGGPSISPDGKMVLLDGLDACSTARYDHEGCQSFPSHVLHMMRASDHVILASPEFPPETQGRPQFIDNTRFLMVGGGIAVVDAGTQKVVERLEDAGDRAYAAVIDRDRGRAYVARARSKCILVLEFETSACSPPARGLSMFFTGDGTFEDAADVNQLTAHGGVRFAPGRVGQAFSLDGTGLLSLDRTGYYIFGRHDLTIALYAKPADAMGEMVLLSLDAEGGERGLRVLKSGDNRIVVECWPVGQSLRSKTVVKPGFWYHIAVRMADHELALYVNGEREDTAAAPPSSDEGSGGPLFLGGRDSGKPSFRGLLDEVAFYNRALMPDEIRSLYELREIGPCKL